MSTNRLNYCQLLGLNPMKESAYSQADISKKIESRMTKWQNDSRNKQNDTEQRFKAERMVESVPDIRRVMEDPFQRKKEFRDGQIILTGKVGKLKQDCVILTDGTYVVLPGIVDSYIKKLHWEGVNKGEVLKLAGIREGQPPKAVSPKVGNAFKGLQSVDAFTPVEMLNTLIKHPYLEIDLDPLTEGSSFTQIRNAFNVCDKRVNSVRPEILPDQDSYIQTMRSVKLVLEPDKELSELIKYGKCQQALVPVMDTVEQEYIGQQLTRNYIDELMNVHLRNKDVDHDMALLIMQSFCYKKKIAANFSSTDSQMIRCPECGNMVQAGPNTVFCPACGKNFKTVCPSCGTPQQSNNLRCIKCGFDFKEGQRKAEALEMKFNLDIKNGMVAKAEEDLVKLKESCPSFAGLAAMELALSKSTSTYNSLRKSVNESFNRKRYHETKGIMEEFVQRYPEVLKEDPELKQKYDEACSNVSSAEICCQKAAVATSQDVRMGCYVNAVEYCPDHPLARGKLKEHPPQGPTDPIGKLGDGKFTIKFEPPEDNNGLIYCIYRARNSLPNVNEESRPIAEIPSSVYVDRSMEPGVEYYYSVYSRRWGVLSKEGAHFGPVIVLADVSTVKIDPIDGGLRVMYEKPRGCTRVRVWRTEGTRTDGIGTEIPLNGESVYDDIGLTGGKKYYYFFVTEYETRNKVERSDGVVFSASTVDAPKPVMDMKIKWNKSDGTYTAQWSTLEDVMLFSCDKRLTIAGNLVKMEDINSWMKEIKPVQTYNNGMRFELQDGSVQYIYPIIPRGKMGIKGNPLMIANLRPFRDVEKTLSNRDCVITMIWPPEAIEAKLVVSNEEAKTLEDSDAEIITIRREEYQQDKLIRVPMGKSDKKCINIFAIYKLNNEMVASRGIVIDVYSAECKKVRYSVKPEKWGMRLTLTSNDPISQIPQVVAVQTDRGIPLRKTDGEVIWRSEGPVTVNGATIDIQCKKPEIENMRLFFEKEDEYNRFRFIHPLYGRDRS